MIRPFRSLAALLTTTLSLAASSLHGAGLDATWGTNGVLSGPGLQGQVGALAEGPAGSLYVARTAALGSVTLIKLSASGVPDTTFGTLTLKLDDASVIEPHALEVQADGKILVLCQNEDVLVLFRVLANGSADAGFNASAQAPYTPCLITQIGPQAHLAGLVAMPDGSGFVAGGSFYYEAQIPVQSGRHSCVL